MLLIIIALIIIDQITKYLALKTLTKGPLIIIENFFTLRLVKNTGAAFGMLSDNKYLFLIIIPIIIAFLIYFLYDNISELTNLQKYSFAMIIAGAIGNYIDRLVYGYVVDFFSFRFGSYDFAVFNIADIAVVLGVMILLFTFRGELLDG